MKGLTYKNMFRKIFYSSLFLSFFIFNLMAEVRAQRAGIEIQPTIIERRADPGEVITASIQITNNGDRRETFYLGKVKIVSATPLGHPLYASPSEEITPLDIPAWISFSKSSLTLDPEARESIDVFIRIPSIASPGGHFAGITVSTIPPALEGTGVAVGIDARTIVSLRVSGDAVEESRIREFRTDRSIYTRPSALFHARVENIGNVLIRPRGVIEISGFTGKRIAAIVVNENRETGAVGAVFPGTARDFENIEWNGEFIAFGRYQAVLSMSYGEDQQKTMSSSVSFWVLPLNIILPSSLGIAVFVFGIFMFIRIRVKQKLREIYETTGQTTGHRESIDAMIDRKDYPPRLIMTTLLLLLFSLLLLGMLFAFFG